MMVAISNTPATITLNSSLDGQTACYGENVTYTCTVTEAASISWTAAPVFTNPILARFSASTPPNERMIGCGDVASIQCNNIDFQATLTNVRPLDGSGTADLTSTFAFTATDTLNGTVVQCSAVTIVGIVTDKQELIVAGM